MAATGPYILHKSSQLCAVVRSNVDFDQNRLAHLKVRFHFPDGADTLPPRLNLKSLSTAVNIFCRQLRLKREQYLNSKSNRKQTQKGLCVNRNSRSQLHDQHISNLLLLSAAGFAWGNDGITDKELERCRQYCKSELKSKGRMKGSERGKEWEEFVQQEKLRVWRRPVECSDLYEYKVFGTFFDINARSFYEIQIDNEHRKVWDKFVLKLDVLDRHPADGSEVLHWVTKFPYPLKNRDYVFVRRCEVDDNSRTMVLISRATKHPDCPEKLDRVRVTSYKSEMLIVPHGTFDEDGFDFVLSYFDDPKVNFPSFCINILTCSNFPDFVKLLHDAAVNIT